MLSHLIFGISDDLALGYTTPKPTNCLFALIVVFVIRVREDNEKKNPQIKANHDLKFKHDLAIEGAIFEAIPRSTSIWVHLRFICYLKVRLSC